VASSSGAAPAASAKKPEGTQQPGGKQEQAAKSKAAHASASKKPATKPSLRHLPTVSNFARSKRHPDFETFDPEDTREIR